MVVVLIDFLLIDKGSQPVSEYSDSLEDIIGLIDYFQFYVPLKICFHLYGNVTFAGEEL
jgi:hypothetical protein